MECPGNYQDPEVGDILFIYHDKDNLGNARYNSLLFQAKKCNIDAPDDYVSIQNKKPVYSICRNEEHQLKLYTDWPAFTYKRAGKLNGEKRIITPQEITTGAQYLVICDNVIYKSLGLKSLSPVECAMAAKDLYINNDLASELVDFFKFRTGREFKQKSDIKIDNSGWSQFIWDMISIANCKTSRRKNSKLNEFPRSVKCEYLDGCCFLKLDTPSKAPVFHQFSSDLSEYSNAPFKDDENSALSIISVENYVDLN